MQEQRPKGPAACSKLRLLLFLCGGILAARTLAAQAYETVHSFSFDHGGPSGGLIQEPDGKLYGVTIAGGAYGKGSVFVLTPDGMGGYGSATLHEFSGGDGEEPRGPLVKGNDGLFYGTTVWGGASGVGAIFRIDTLGNFELVHSIAGDEGQNPVARLLLADDGNFYGTTIHGGPGGFGAAFRLDSAGTVTQLRFFNGIEGHPYGGFVQAGDGLLYGPATGGGAGYGTLYRMTLDGTVTVLHTFSGADVSDPIHPLMKASDGKMYGTAAGFPGEIYRIDTAGVFTLLHVLSGNEGPTPSGPLIEASDGKLYGTTFFGGAQGVGQVYRVSTAGAFESVISFESSGPQAPRGQLLELSPGTFLVISMVAVGFQGAIMRVDLPSTVSVVHSFGSSEGREPAGALRQATDGLLYGTTTGAGPFGFGTLFRLDPATSNLETLHAFSNADGAYPASRLLQASDGHLYGTSGNSASNFGTVFRLGLDGAFTPLDDFSSTATDAPVALIEATDGYLYGSVQAGVLRLDFSGNPEMLVTSPGDDGFNSGIVQASDGWLYGTGVNPVTGHSFVFRASVQGAYEEVYTFTGGFEGLLPFAGLLVGSDGNLYGTTTEGGIDSNGTVFRYEPLTGALTTLYSFGSVVSGDASFTFATLVEGSDGSLFGTTQHGGLHGRGTVFRVSPTGEESVVHSFGGGGDDGIQPDAGVILVSDGLLYGTTVSGGEYGGGTVFRVDPEAVLSVTSVTPSSGPAEGGTAVTISGGVFLPGAIVLFGTADAGSVMVVGEDQIDATTPALEAGTLYHAFVTSPDGGSGSLARAWLADFNDVPGGDLFHDSVASLVRNGVTAGCGFGNYCGSQPVTRAQMAVFLLRSKLGASYVPPPATGTVFSDVPASSFAADYIEDLAARGVTVGCGGGRYCPQNPVRRAQMAAFLLRALLGPGYTPPDAVGIFADVPVDAFAANYIEDLYGRGITAGCSASPLLYCPASFSTRSQMAAFLVETFSLP